MGRHSLSTVMALGAVISLVGGAGLFAVFTDRATTGESSAISAAEPHLALQVAPASLVNGLIECGSFGDDLATGLLTMTDAQAGAVRSAYVCLYNGFESVLAVSATAIDLVDRETSCSGDEATYDLSCDPTDAFLGVGELSSFLDVSVAAFPTRSCEAENCDSTIRCDPTSPTGGSSDGLADIAAGGRWTLGARGQTGWLSAGSVECVAIDVSYATTATWLDRQTAQTDQATWRFAFDGTE